MKFIFLLQGSSMKVLINIIIIIIINITIMLTTMIKANRKRILHGCSRIFEVFGGVRRQQYLFFLKIFLILLY
jgi:flagellar motor component MotA